MKHTMKVCSMLFALIAVFALVAGPAHAQKEAEYRLHHGR